MGKCLSFLQTGTWPDDKLLESEQQTTQLKALGQQLDVLSEKVREEKRLLMEMHDNEGIALPKFQHQVSRKIIDYQSALRELKVARALYADCLGVVTAERLTEAVSANEEMKRKAIVRIESMQKRSRKDDDQTNEEKKRTENLTRFTHDAVAEIHANQEADPLLAEQDTSTDNELGFGAEIRKWKREESNSGRKYAKSKSAVISSSASSTVSESATPRSESSSELDGQQRAPLKGKKKQKATSVIVPLADDP